MKKTWTKLILAILTLAMILSLTGCPKKGPDPTPTPSTSSQQPTPTPSASGEGTPTPTPTQGGQGTPTPTPEPTPTPPVDPGKVNEFLKAFLPESALLKGDVVWANGEDYEDYIGWVAYTELDGFFAASNNAGKDKTASEMKLNFGLAKKSDLTFKVKVDVGTESGWDGFYMIVDGVVYTGDGTIIWAEGAHNFGHVFEGWSLNKAIKGIADDVILHVFKDGEHTVNLCLDEGNHEIRFGFLKDWAGGNKTERAYMSTATLTEHQEEEPPEPKNYEVGFNAAGLRVDAYKDEIYNHGEPIEINSALGFANKDYNADNYDGKFAKAWVAHDGTGLYIYAEVSDNSIHSDEYYANGNESNDCLQVYLDFVRDFEATGKKGSEYKATGTAGSRRLGFVAIAPSGRVFQVWGFGGVPEVAGAARKIDGGYAVELYVPFPESKVGTIGIGFEVHDDITGTGNTKDAYYYSASNGTGWWNSYETLTPYDLAEETKYEGRTAAYTDKVWIDAAKDSAYKNAIKIESGWTGNPANAEGTGVTYVAFDGTYLYLYTEVKDSTVQVAVPPAKADGGDAVQYYFDFPHASKATGLTGGAYHSYANQNPQAMGYVQIARDGNRATLKTSYGISADEVVCAAKEVEGGYVLECSVKMPEETIKALARGAVTSIGLGIQVNDDFDGKPNSGGDYRDAIFCDAPDTINVWSNYALCGELLLDANDKVPADDPNVYQAAFSATGIKLDALKDPIYNSSTMINIDNRWANSKEGAFGDGKAWIAHDGTGFYIYAEIHDETIFMDDYKDAEYGDGIQFYFDYQNSHETDGLEGVAYRNKYKDGNKTLGWIAVAPNGIVKSNYGFRAENIPEVRAATKLIENGYAVELYVGFADTMADVVGIAFQVNEYITKEALGGTTRDAIYGDTDKWGIYYSTYQVLKDVVRLKGEAYTGRVAAYTDKINLDGHLDEVYKNGTELILDKSTYWSNNPADYNGSGKAYFAFTDDALYLYVAVNDTTIISADKDDKNAESGDKVCLYLDFKGSMEAEGLDSGAYKKKYANNSESAINKKTLGWICVDPTGNIKANFGFRSEANDGTPVEGTDYKFVVTSEGYAVELRVPLADHLMASLKSNAITTIGAGFEVHDDINGDNNRDAVFGDSADAVNYWAMYGLFPTLKFDKSTFQANTETSKFYEAAHVAAGLIVDGKKDDAYDDSKAILFNNAMEGANPDAKGFGKAWIANDAKGIYVYAEIMDDTLGETPSKGDKFTIYLDYLNNHGQEGVESGVRYRNQYQKHSNNWYMSIGSMTVFADGTYDFACGMKLRFNNNADNSEMPIATSRIEGGWAVECYIAFDVFTTDTFGLGFEAYDDITGDGKSDAVYMDQDLGQSYDKYYEGLKDIIVDRTGLIGVGTAVVDGEYDEAYAAGQKISTRTFLGKPYFQKGQPNVDATIIHDDKGLYIYATVEDTTIYDHEFYKVGDEGNDNVQFYIDFARDYEEKGVTGDKYKATGTDGSRRLGFVGVGPTGVVYSAWGFKIKTADGVKVTDPEIQAAAKLIDGGYVIEVFIPFAGEDIMGDIVGIGMQLNDDTNQDHKVDLNRWDIYYGWNYYNMYENLPMYKLA